MPTHCTITPIGFSATRIDGVTCGLFSYHTLLGKTTLRVGRVSVAYTVLEKVDVRVTVSVTCLSNVIVWDDGERKGEGETRCRLIACSSRKAPRGPPSLTSPSDGRIAINSTICVRNIYTALGLWNLIQGCDVHLSSSYPRG